jgi:hypothetical protein
MLANGTDPRGEEHAHTQSRQNLRNIRRLSHSDVRRQVKEEDGKTQWRCDKRRVEGDARFPKATGDRLLLMAAERLGRQRVRFQEALERGSSR